MVARLFSLHLASLVSVTASWSSPVTSTPSRVLVPARIRALTFCVPDKDSCPSHQTVWAAQRAHHNLLLPWLLHNPEGLYDYDDEGVWTLRWDYCRTAQQLGVDIFLSSPLTLTLPLDSDQKSQLEHLQSWVVRRPTMCGRKPLKTSRRCSSSWRSWDREYTFAHVSFLFCRVLLHVHDDKSESFINCRQCHVKEMLEKWRTDGHATYSLKESLMRWQSIYAAFAFVF